MRATASSLGADPNSFLNIDKHLIRAWATVLATHQRQGGAQDVDILISAQRHPNPKRPLTFIREVTYPRKFLKPLESIP